MPSITGIITDQLQEAKVIGVSLAVIVGCAMAVFYIVGSIQQSAYYNASLQKLSAEGYGNTGTAESVVSSIQADGIPI